MTLAPGIAMKRTVMYSPWIFITLYNFLLAHTVQFKDSREPLPIQVSSVLYSEDLRENCVHYPNEQLTDRKNNPAQEPDQPREHEEVDKQKELDIKKLSSLSQRLSSGNKFLINKLVETYISSYQYANIEQHLSNEPSINWLHHLFKDEFHIFYQAHIEGKYKDSRAIIGTDHTRIQLQDRAVARVPLP